MTDPSQPSSSLLVTGATGMIGGLVVEALRERGVALSVMVRPSADVGRLAEREGVRMVRGDFDDPSSLRAALAGVDRAFLVTNSSERTEAQQRDFVAAAQEAGVRHLVKLSQLHAKADSPVRFLRYHAAVESAIEMAGLAHTFLRPNLVLQAYLPYARAVAAGVLQAPLSKDARVSVVDARDIAAVAAAALTEDGHDGRTYDVTGPAAVTHADIAAVLGHAAGHGVRFQQVSPADFISAVEQQGMPAWQAEGLAEDYAHYNRGEAATVSADVEQVTGRPPRSLNDFATDYATAFRAS